MELILFIGIQATGKSTFYRERFNRTHVHVNLDMLKTRHREELIFKACLEGKARFVVDNTNLTRQERARYIVPAKSAGFTVIGYFFQSRVVDALRRNSAREAGQRIPDKGVLHASRRLELPSVVEGFDQLYFVRMNEPDGFMMEEWRE